MTWMKLETGALLLAVVPLACAEPGEAMDTTATDDGGDAEGAEAPALVAEPELVFHPKQPMVVDLIVELDRPAELTLTHDEDPGVRVASLAVEDEGRRHHLRLRGLAPARDHGLSLERTDPESGARATSPVAFTTEPALPGYRESWDLELGDPAAVDPAYRIFDYAYTAVWDPTGIFVIDAEGRTRWYYGDTPAYVGFGAVTVWAGIELRPDGTLLAVRDGAVTVLDELGETRARWSSFDYNLSQFHHEAEQLANGNVLTLGNDWREVDLDGYGPTYVAGDYLVELDPAGEIVWTWSAFDHLDAQRMRVAPEDAFDYYNPFSEQFAYDWTHGNGMVDMPEQGQLLLSMRHQDWIIAIDHESGEVLWRLGEGGDFELLAGEWFYHQHSPQWQPDGSLLLYDNNVNNPELDPVDIRSRAVRYELDFEAMTAAQVWEAPVDYVSPGGGDADRTPGGSVLVADTATGVTENFASNRSRLREHAEGQVDPVWSLTTPTGGYIYRATADLRLPGEALDGG